MKLLLGIVKHILSRLFRLYMQFFLRKHKGVIISIEQYTISNCVEILYHTQIDRLSYPIFYIKGSGMSQHCIRELSNQYVCLLKCVAVIGGSNILLSKSGYIIHDLLSNGNDNYRITDQALVSHNKIGLFAIVKYYVSGKTIDQAIDMTGNYSFNYYHFIIEFISKFFLLTKCNIPEDVPIIVDEIVKRIPSMFEILSLFSGKRQLIFLKPSKKYKVKNLYVTTFVNQIIPNYVDINKIEYKDNLFSPESLLYIRKMFLNHADVGKYNSYKRIFIGKKTKTFGRDYNESELIDIVKKYGINVIYPEDYSAKEQFGLFSNAQCIIAASGAALTNIICCQPECKVLVLFNREIDLSIFSSIGGIIGFDIRYLIGDCHDISELHSSYQINKEEFSNCLTNWLIKE